MCGYNCGPRKSCVSLIGRKALEQAPALWGPSGCSLLGVGPRTRLELSASRCGQFGQNKVAALLLWSLGYGDTYGNRNLLLRSLRGGGLLAFSVRGEVLNILGSVGLRGPLLTLP